MSRFDFIFSGAFSIIHCWCIKVWCSCTYLWPLWVLHSFSGNQFAKIYCVFWSLYVQQLFFCCYLNCPLMSGVQRDAKKYGTVVWGVFCDSAPHLPPRPHPYSSKSMLLWDQTHFAHIREGWGICGMLSRMEAFPAVPMYHHWCQLQHQLLHTWLWVPGALLLCGKWAVFWKPWAEGMPLGRELSVTWRAKGLKQKTTKWKCSL